MKTKKGITCEACNVKDMDHHQAMEHLGHDYKEPQHTPTPWHFEKGRFNSDDLSDSHIGSIVSEKDFILAAINGDAGSSEEVEANAAFIVRAVNAHEELLEAAKIGLRYMKPEEKVIYGVDKKIVERAIAKAEGK